MKSRLIKLRHGPRLIVRPLRNGDAATVLALFQRLGPESRRLRFNGPKPCLSDAELAQFSRVDDSQHVLVGYVDPDPGPVAIARLARTDRDSAEIAFAVADEHQHLGIGSALTAELVADARAAGITEITALASADNPAALALIRRAARVTDVRREGPELSIRAAIA
jgi:ribosomal protein S18 acetylase RimI-like enzyme